MSDGKPKLDADSQRWLDSDENQMDRLLRQTAKAAGEEELTQEELDKLRDDAESKSTS